MGSFLNSVLHFQKFWTAKDRLEPRRPTVLSTDSSPSPTRSAPTPPPPPLPLLCAPTPPPPYPTVPWAPASRCPTPTAIFPGKNNGSPPETVEWFIQRARLSRCRIIWLFTPSPRQWVRPATHRQTEKERYLAEGRWRRGGGGGGEGRREILSQNLLMFKEKGINSKAWRAGTTNRVIVPPPGYIGWQNRFLEIDSWAPQSSNVYSSGPL